MKPEEQRIAIAEACGWKRCRIPIQSKSDPLPRGWALNGKGGWSAVSCVPDYLNDLNAMHEAVMSQKDNQDFCPIEYTDNLLDVVRFNSRLHSERGCFAHTNATAAQRAEAFLRTLGLYK